jgi:hypothetical protein
LYIALTHTDQFRYLGDFRSGLPDQKGFEEKYGSTLSEKAARLKVVYFGYGTRDPAKPNSLSVQKMFDKYGIRYKSVETPGGHVWANWRFYLSQFAPLLFR